MTTQNRLRKIAVSSRPRTVRNDGAQAIAGSMEARTNPALALAAIQGKLTPAQFQAMARSAEATSNPSLVLTAARAGMTSGQLTEFANHGVGRATKNPTAGAALLQDAKGKRAKARPETV
jgi:hypothetical protein